MSQSTVPRTGVPTQRTRGTVERRTTSAASEAAPPPPQEGRRARAVVRAWRDGARDVLRGLERHWSTMAMWRL